MPISQFLINFILFKVEFCFGKAQNTIIPLQSLLESFFFLCILKISLEPDLLKPFFSVYTLITASQEQPGKPKATEPVLDSTGCNIFMKVKITLINLKSERIDF